MPQPSLQAAYHPDRVLYPMKRTNPKDAPDPGWVRITWDEAYSTMAENYQELIDKYGGETIMMMSGTSRCWCMGAYGVFPLLFQSPNRVTPYQVCKGPRHFATLMQSSYAFSWQATVDKPRVMVRWGGSTEMSNYDDSCRMTVDSAKEADAFITVDPRLSNLGRESTIWQHLYPQTDGALALSWIHVVIENKLYDELFVKRWTDAPFLVCEEMGPTPGPMGAKMQAGFFQTMTRLVCESDLKEDGSPFRLMCWDAIQNSRALDTLVGITGNWDTPAGNRGGTTSFLRTIDVNFGGNVNMGGMGLNVQCVERPGEVEYDPVFNIKLHEAMGRPFSDDPKNPYPTEEEYCDWFVRASGMTWKQMVEKFQKDGWWDCKAMTLKSLEGDPEGWLDAGGTWGLYRRYQLGMLRPDKKPGLTTPTGKLEIWSTVMETFYTDETDPLYNADEKYHDDPDYAGVEGHARDILPDWRPAPLGRAAAPEMEAEYPFICNTGRRIPVYFHSEHRQLPWCREQWPVPRIEMHPADAEKVGVKQGDWVWIENENGKIRQVVDLYEGIEPGVVNCEHQWWYPELNQMGHGFELSGVNCLVYRDVRDRHSASSYLRAYPVKVYKATPENSPFNNPVPCGEDGKEIITAGNDPRLKEWAVLNYGEGE
ncbi:molybdopterin-dependent oxidoreductase [Eggerthellaceae bacterium zg-887]|uniref:molybdopterin dinucleotide binding domain-containing protein n=1 Tax=Xiamenia xianingshaonis TaxID=2682776 RepID=UPI00140AAE17|nr:molybdopterin dinucleotide binding domain-containing protein [Xiamenia xianingshaonis]NHM16552.1 molybdopterin-dependent oxidoreductase [Xiamenia xianingshaonis]